MHLSTRYNIVVRELVGSSRGLEHSAETVVTKCVKLTWCCNLQRALVISREISLTKPTIDVFFLKTRRLIIVPE